jgi:hypothetical protein
MAINGIYTEPGVFSQFEPTRTFPVIPGGVRVTALVGAGRTTNIISGEVVTKGSLDATDTLAHTATSLGATITDQDFNTYHLTTDYILTGGGVAWSPNTPAAITGTVADPYNGLVGKTFKATIADANGGLEQTYTFLLADFAIPTAATAAEVVTALGAAFSGEVMSVDTGKVKIATATGNNTSLLIGIGTANSILGFTDGSFQQTPREPVPGKTYSVSYEYAKAAGDYVPTFFFNMTDVQNAYGPPNATNTLSLGAQVVFEQGASAVCLIQTNPDDGSEFNMFKNALDKLLPVSGINIVVALSTLPALHSYLETHCNTASSITERRERTCIIAMPQGSTPTAIGADALALANKRVVLVSSTTCSRFLGSDLTATTLNGSYIAAAVAGIRTSSAYDVADPSTRKEIVGFADVTDGLLRQQKILLLSQGVMVIENINGIIRIMRQVTTDPSVVENYEYSVVETIDFVASTMRTSLETIYIGQKILGGTPSQIRTTIQALLNTMIQAQILTAAQNVNAAIDNSDPTQINVSFEISPVFPLNFILITFSLSPNQ